MKLDPKKTALVTAIFIGGGHFFWSLIVASGLAQSLLDFILWVHFLQNPYVVAPFDIVRMLVLVAVTFAVGYIGGWIFAILWNKLHGEK